MLVVISNRVPRLDYGEDRLLMIAIDMFRRRGFEIALCILSKNICIDSRRRLGIEDAMNRCRYLVIHHDVSLVKILLFLLSIRKAIRQNIETMHIVYFIDTYSPTTLLRNIVGWFLAQLWSSYIATSRYAYKRLRKFLIVRGKYIPIWRVYRFHTPKQATQRIYEPIRIVYIGAIDSERLNTREIAELVYKLHKAFNKSIEIYIVTRPDQRAREIDRMIRPWLRLIVIKRLLSDDEKRKLLSRCHIAVFTAKRIRFVVPPLFVVEAHSCGCLIYAPHLADMLREEGLSNVYSSITELIEVLRETMR